MSPGFPKTITGIEVLMRKIRNFRDAKTKRNI